jgi:hypothetical protein
MRADEAERADDRGLRQIHGHSFPDVEAGCPLAVAATPELPQQIVLGEVHRHVAHFARQVPEDAADPLLLVFLCGTVVHLEE